MNPAAAACPLTAAMVGRGRERKSATRDLNSETMRMRRWEDSEGEPAARDQERSKPLEKNLPSAVVIRA